MIGRILVGLLAILVAFGSWLQVGIESSVIPERGEICQQAEHSEEKECSVQHISLVIVWKIVEFFKYFESEIATLSTIVIALFTWRLWWSTDGLWREAKSAGDAANTSAKAAKASADASLLALRPWLSCEIRNALDLIFTPEGDALFSFHFIVQNIGRSPATNIRFDEGITILSAKAVPADAQLQRMIDNRRQMPIGVPAVSLPGNFPLGTDERGLLLFPEKRHVFKYKLRIKRADLDASFSDIEPAKHFFPQVFGLVSYSYALAGIRADTSFVCDISKIDGRVFEADESVPVDQIEIEQTSGIAT